MEYHSETWEDLPPSDLTGRTLVKFLDVLGSGFAYHDYQIVDKSDETPLASLHFQSGPIVDGGGVNGITNEDLLLIVAHRLKSFQDGPYRCLENALSLCKVQEALEWLRERTRRRVSRGVEGTNQI